MPTLATAPGSITELSPAAKLLTQGVAMVTAYHLVRIFIIISLMPLLIRVALGRRIAFIGLPDGSMEQAGPAISSRQGPLAVGSRRWWDEREPMTNAIRFRIDLVSDTSTRPSAGMRRAMADAPVGDEQRGEDPSVNALRARVAELLGTEDAVFLPSGSMCNQIAILVHCRPGDEIIAAENSHIVGSEGAGAAALAGAMIRPIRTQDGIFDADDVAAAIRKPYPKSPRSRLVHLEQTANRGGGAVWPLETMQAVAQAGRAHGLALHMDGARLMNAVVASGISAARYAAPFDSVWLDLSKGLGCPVGGVLAGSKAFIEAAWIHKHRLGGAMRQSGILAAAGLYALDHNIERLAEDHENARFLADRLRGIRGLVLDPPEVQTNLIFFDVARTGLGADAIAGRLRDEGIRIGVEGPTRMRAVTHLDVDRFGVETAAEAIAHIVGA